MTMYGLAKIQEQLDRSRERLLVAIESLPDEALLAPGAAGRFSVADLLAQLAVWEAELVTGLMRLDQGQRPDELLAALAQPEAYNARRYAENKGRDLDLIFDDLQRVRVQLEMWLEAFSDRDLTESRRYKWLKGKSLGQIIAEATFGKETKAIPGLETFARRWAGTHSVDQAEDRRLNQSLIPDLQSPQITMLIEVEDDDLQ